MQIEREAQAKKRKRAEMADGKREEKRLAAQAAAARDVVGGVANGDADDDAGVHNGSSEAAAQHLHERGAPLQLSMQNGGAAAEDIDGVAVQPQKVRRGARLFGDDDKGAANGRDASGGSEQQRKRNKACLLRVLLPVWCNEANVPNAVQSYSQLCQTDHSGITDSWMPAIRSLSNARRCPRTHVAAKSCDTQVQP